MNEIIEKYTADINEESSRKILEDSFIEYHKQRLNLIKTDKVANVMSNIINDISSGIYDNIPPIKKDIKNE